MAKKSKIMPIEQFTAELEKMDKKTLVVFCSHAFRAEDRKDLVKFLHVARWTIETGHALSVLEEQS